MRETVKAQCHGSMVDIRVDLQRTWHIGENALQVNGSIHLSAIGSKPYLVPRVLY